MWPAEVNSETPCRSAGCLRGCWNTAKQENFGLDFLVILRCWFWFFFFVSYELWWHSSWSPFLCVWMLCSRMLGKIICYFKTTHLHLKQLFKNCLSISVKEACTGVWHLVDNHPSLSMQLKTTHFPHIFILHIRISFSFTNGFGTSELTCEWRKGLLWSFLKNGSRGQQRTVLSNLK